jgi:hypothetical protein
LPKYVGSTQISISIISIPFPWTISSNSHCYCFRKMLVIWILEKTYSHCFRLFGQLQNNRNLPLTALEAESPQSSFWQIWCLVRPAAWFISSAFWLCPHMVKGQGSSPGLLLQGQKTPPWKQNPNHLITSTKTS